MKKAFLVAVLVLLGAIGFAQNNDASKYVANPETALADAKKALSNGDYKQATKLASLYNALSNTQGGDSIIRLAEKQLKLHERHDAAMASGKQKHSAGQYAEAMLDYLAAHEILPEDKGTADAIQKCAKDALAKKVNISTELNAARKLWDYSSTLNDETTAEYAAYLGSGNAVQSLYNKALYKNDLSRAMTFATLASMNNGNNTMLASVGDLYVQKAKKESNYASRKAQYQNAVICYTGASNKGNIEASYKLSDLYYSAIPVKDLGKALTYCRIAADANFAPAKQRLGQIQEAIAASENERRKAPMKRFLSNFDATESANLGLAYSFGKYTGELSAYGNYSYFSFRLSVGGTDAPFVYECSSEKTSTVDYIWYKPGMFFMAAPGAFFNYFSVDVGLGAMLTPKVLDLSSQKFDVPTKTVVTIDGKDKEIVQRNAADMPKAHFLIEPRLTAHIPIFYGQFAITAHIGYSYIPNLKEMCGIIWGIGFTGNIE